MSIKFVETTEQQQQLKKMLSEYKTSQGSLMMAMQKAQEIYGYLPIEVQSRIAEAYDVPLEEVYGIATFYAQFNIQPMGKYKIGICLGTACYVKGSGDIFNKLAERLGVNAGETTPDGKFTLEATRCIGCCGLAPVLTVNEHVYGNLTVDDVDKILYQYND